MRFVKRLKRKRSMLFTFLAAGTDSHNNTAERAVRHNVTIRKTTNGGRSDKGAVSHQVMMGIKETCRQRRMNFWDFLVEQPGRIALKN